MLVPPVDAIMLTLPILWSPQHAKAVIATTALTLLLLTNGRCYRARLHLSVLDELPWLVARIATATTVTATVTALRHQQEAVTSFLVVSVISLGLFVAGRVLTTQIILWARRRGFVSHRTIIVGNGTLSIELAAILQHYPRYGLKVEGILDDVDPGPISIVPWLGPIHALGWIIEDHSINAIIVADGNFDEDELLELVRRPASCSCELLVVPRLYHLHTLVGLPDHIGSIPVMRISRPSLTGFAWALKRTFDVVVCVVLLLFFSPVLLLCAVAVRFEGGRGVLFRQRRVGKNGKVFDCFKFRSMKPGDFHEAETQWSIANDARVGKVGRFLRKTSLDELPQLWNILRGDMTLVGPRPERPYFVERFSAEIPGYRYRHRVPAGLTGFAQVSGLRGNTPITDRARFDNYYIENWSLWMDAKVLIRTFGEVLFARGR